MLFKSSKWLKAVLFALTVVILLGSAILYIAYRQQDRLVDSLVFQLNRDFNGRLEIGGSHISPFANFPYISIDLEHIKVFESKSDTSEMLVHVSDTYIGFDTWSLIRGSFVAKKITLDSGFLKLVQHPDGTFNPVNALSVEDTTSTTSSSSSADLDLQAIELINIDLLKLNEENNLLIEAFIEHATSNFKTNKEFMEIGLDSKFLFNLIIDGDTSFLHDKHMEIHTNLKLDAQTNVLSVDPSEVLVENALFMMDGEVDIDNNMDLNLNFSGNKPNFDLFLAFAPPELSPVLSRYDNGGNIYFKAKIDGPSINGVNPAIDIDFGCEEAFFRNTSSNKTVNDLFFEGHFTNGPDRTASTMELFINDFSARPETGVFQGNILIKNFESPEFDIQLLSDFDLDFLFKFLNISDLEDVSGKVFLEMNFHDIIDLSQPEKSIERLNESYFTKLEVKDLNVKSSIYPLPVTDVNIKAEMDGHEARIDQLDFKVGESNVAIAANVSDLPAILHHTDLPVEAHLDIKSTLIDLEELTKTDSTDGIKEQIKDLSMKFKFMSSAKAFTESPNLPLGEFFVEKLHASFSNYPHELHDFNADVYIDTANFRVIDFTGMIDQSDFHFNGRLENYDLWFAEIPIGDTKVDFNLSSDLLQLDDLFSYGGENYVPEDYRHEEFSNLKLHGLADMRFDKKLVSTTIDIDQLEAKMKVHPMRFENFEGQIYFDSVLLKITDLGGKLGNSDFKANLSYFTGEDTLTTPHSFSLTSNRLDFDQLFAYNPPPKDQVMTPEDHEDVFNIFEVPFANFNFSVDINTLNYHRYLIDDFQLKGRMQSDHFLFLDTMHFQAAGGQVALAGYFNGSDPKAIYFSPDVAISSLDLDQLLFKFENFGQDHLVSENLHGNLSGTMKGKIHMHADMVPIIDDSRIHMEFTVVDGSINNYDAFEALSDYFSDKNLSNVRFDTLTNTMDLQEGTLIIPDMSINSTIGYFEVSGRQNTDLSMEYYIRIPVKVVTKASLSKLFANKKTDNSDQVDEILYKEDMGNSGFLNLKLEGTPEDYRITVGKNR